MAGVWDEVTAVKSENRRELSLIGPEISKRIEEGGLDKHVFELVNLNFLDISRTCLSSVADDLGNLKNLTNLILQGNTLVALPPSLGNLTKLKFLDISHNKLETLPAEIANLVELQTLNAHVNQLADMPDVSTLKALHILNISHNKLSSLPDGLCDEGLVHLSQVNASNNEITEVPSQLSALPHLNILYLANNKIEELPSELCECTKLKELTLSGNKLKDRKLSRFAEQNSMKQIMTYLAATLQKEMAAAGGKKDKKVKPKKKKKGQKDTDVEELAKNVMSVLRFSDDGLLVRVEGKVGDVRPYIVCCVIQDLNFKKSVNMFKRFIRLQTILHETLCQKRQAATIATHDVALVKGPLVYTSRAPQSILIHPLFQSKEVTAVVLVKELRKEADALRKEKKRGTVSGIHKYLDLLKDKQEFPCLLDAEGHVISFPPITNSEKTKISKETRSVLVEVTSSISLDFCKKVMDTLLKDTLQTGVGSAGEGGGVENDDDDDDAKVDGDGDKQSSGERLTLQQVKIVDEEGGLKVLYPSRTDLQDEGFNVNRDWE